MRRTFLRASLLLVSLASNAHAGVVGQRSEQSSSGSTSGVEVQLQPVLAKALARANVHEIAALQPCNAGWPYSPLFDASGAVRWAAERAQDACVVNSAETQLADALTRRTWASPEAVQRAADALALKLDYGRFRRACPAPPLSAVYPITSGDSVKVRINRGALRLALTCDAGGVSITRGGAQIFGQGTINGRAYSVRLEHAQSSSSSVSGAFLN
jgi:hypothetical protein